MSRLPVASATLRNWQNVLENNFTGGLKTEFTGLNFPENSCTSTTNCTFYQTGAVFRRNGFDYESGFTTSSVNRANSAISTFIWTNAGGDGSTKLYVVQIGLVIYFYQITNATISSPLSTTKLVSTVSISNSDPTVECQYATGNGYLFVFNPTIDPFYCTFSGGVVNSAGISIQIRDFVGTGELTFVGPDTYRPTTLTNYHQYNLQNQGWTSQAIWTANSSDRLGVLGPGGLGLTLPIGLLSFNVQSGLSGITVGQAVTILGSILVGSTATFNSYGLVNSYAGSVLTVNVTSSGVGDPTIPFVPSATPQSYTLTPANPGGQITTWHTAVGNYPSNADVWWSFKNSSLVFDPLNTVANVTLGSGPAPKGFYIMQAFNQQRSGISGVSGLTDTVTSKRPKTGTFFAGRVWYTGVDDGSITAGSATSWSENIYYSQIVVKSEQFARCYQTNDPTSETLFDLLPSDGGVITIQGSGSIYKLFPITNGLLVFAANGIWFITGSTGIGFTATDYTISKLSAIQSISSTSFVDVLGYPMFWNEEGIYSVGIDAQSQGLSVNSLTLHTIKQFYDKIPKQSKKFARGSYNAITGQVQWIYRSTNESSVTDRYQYDSVLNLSMFIQAFYPWSISTGPYVHDIQYVTYAGGANSPQPTFKYLTSNLAGTYQFTFSEERDNVNWKDWNSAGNPLDYTSSLVTAYRLHGDAQRKFQPTYVYIYSDNPVNSSYKLQGQWNYAIDPNSGKYSTVQTASINVPKFGKAFRRFRIRGNGYILQMHIFSVSGKQFNIMGWSLAETQAASV